MSLVPPFLLVDRYDVSDEIGRGGHAVVYRAHDRVLDREVAVKILREDALSSDTLARFRQEVQVTAQLEHAHILHVYDTGAYEGRPYIVMELASGRTLADRLAREGQLPVADALQIARDVGLALAHAHARGVVHRDVKPDNILLGTGGAILADFGIARVTQEELTRKITSTGTAVGTVQYMSPEQLCAEPNIDARSDQYALACVLYEMLAGVRPHIAATFEGLRMLRMTGQHVPVSAHRPSVPGFVDETIAVALSPMPADRYRSVEAMLAAMGVAASGEFSAVDGSGSTRGSGGFGGVYGSGGARAMTPGAGARSAVSGADATALGGTRKRWVIPAVAVAVAVVAGLVYAVRGGAGGSSAPLAPGDVAVVVTADGERAVVADTTSSLGRLQASLREELGLWPAVRVQDRVARGDSSLVVLTPTINAIADSVRIQLSVRQGSAARPPLSVMASATELRAPGALAKTLVLQSLVRQIDPQLTHVETPGVEALPGRSMSALRAYVRGFAALRGGELDTASARFREAAQQAPGFAQAEYWAAQSGAWAAPTRVDSWRPSVERAVRSGTLHGVDSLLAVGLQRMANAAFPEACGVYREATARAPESFEAWYGLGECQRLDSVVVETPQGLRFRSSFWSALNSYQRAIPIAHTSPWLGALFRPIASLTFAAGNEVRPGRVSSLADADFFALPSLSADTLAFFPIPRMTFQAAGMGTVPETWIPALRRGRGVLMEATGIWVARWPQSSIAWYYRAIALELSGRIAVGALAGGADAALAQASLGSPAPQLRAEIAIARARVSLRRGDLAASIRVARAALRSSDSLALPIAAMLAPLAALAGDEARAIRLGVASSEPITGVPSSLSDSLRVFTVRSQLGICDGLDDARIALERLTSSVMPASALASERERLLFPAYVAAVPCLSPKIVSAFNVSHPLAPALRALATGDLTAAKNVLSGLRVARSGATMATLTWDYLFAESWALAQTGDSAVARQQILAALDDVAGMSSYTLSVLSHAAGLRRSIALLHDLAANAPAPERKKAQQWYDQLRFADPPNVSAKESK